MDVETVRSRPRLCVVTGQSQNGWVEGAGELRKSERPIPYGIDRDEQGLHIGSLVAEVVHDLRHLGQRRRTDVGTIGKAEEDQQVLALKIRLRPKLPFCVRQSKGRTKRRLFTDRWTAILRELP